MKSLIRLAWVAALCTVAAAATFAAFAQDSPLPPGGPFKWSLKSDLPAQPLKAGDKFALELTAEIAEGWHLYSTEQIPEGPQPTRITLAPEQPFELKEVEAPDPKKEFDQNFGVETEFYDGSVTFKLPVRVKTGAPVGTHKLTVQVRYQGCTETLCLPPKVVKLEAEVRIRN